MTPPTRAWIEQLPKAEVHCHLEGCLPPELVRSAADRQHNAQAPGGISVDSRSGKPRISSLGELLRYLDWSCALLGETYELEAMAYGIASRARANGVEHTDVIVNPTHWPQWRGRLPQMVEALDSGFAAGERDYATTATLCVSLKRTQSRAEALETVDLLVAMAHPRVSALSIDGNEAEGAESHNERFAPAFDRAGSSGLHRCAHAGESSGAGGVREAIELLGAERIDHGIRCLEDEEVTALVVERSIPLDVCPRSNVVLGVAESIAKHPIRALTEIGVRCSLNTDDPLIYGIDLVGEYETVAQAFGWGTTELAAMARVGIESCFAGEDRRFTLLKHLDDHLSV